MIQLGETQELTVVKRVEFGVYLAADGPQERQRTVSGADRSAGQEKVLLPKKQTPENAQTGDRIKVFVYRDSKDRLIATTAVPKLTLGRTALLRVVQTGTIGAFLDWGLEKDLLLPFREQTWPVKEGEDILTALYVDKSGRLCATMKVYPYLSTDSPYQKDDRVQGLVYETSDRFGAFVAVDDVWSGLIPLKELYGSVKPGERINARVTGVKEDGKLDLSLREKAYLQIGTDAEKVMEALEKQSGSLPFNDKAAPEKIRDEMKMSKNEFKRAVGHLLKQGKITITDNGIVKNEKNP